MELTSWSILQPGRLHSEKKMHYIMNTWGHTVADNVLFCLAVIEIHAPDKWLSLTSLIKAIKPKTNKRDKMGNVNSLFLLHHEHAGTHSPCTALILYNMFKVPWGGMLRGRPHGSTFWFRRSIDLSVNQCEAVQNRHSTGKVIGVSEPAELAQINRSLNRLFTAVIRHDAWGNRRHGGSSSSGSTARV